MGKAAVFLGTFLLLTACAFNVKKPINRFVSPETSGAFLGGQLETFIAGSAEIELIDNKHSDSPNTDPSVDENSDPGLGAQLGLFTWMDLYFSSSFDGPNVGGLKIQPVGDSRLNAKKGNFALALFAGGLWGDQTEESSSGDVSSNVDNRFSGYEAGFGLGYRPKDFVQVYSNLIYSEMTAEFNLDQTEGGVTNEDLVAGEGKGNFQSVALGVKIGEELYIQLEGAYTISNWTRMTKPELDADEMKNFVYGVNSGFQW